MKNSFLFSSRRLRPFLLGMVIPCAVWAAEPMMDISLLETSRMGAVNAVKTGDFAQALQGEEQALKIAQDQFGPTSLSLVPILEDKGVLQWRLARYGEAEQTLKWCLALMEKNLGPGDPKLADPLDLLAALYLDVNRLEEALLLGKRALALRGAGLPEDCQALANSQELLGRIELASKHAGQALALFQKARDILEKLPKPDPAVSIHLWKDLAQASFAQQNLAQTRTCLEKAVATAQQDFSPDSPQAADGMLDLANFDRGHGSADKSRGLDESALAIARKFVGTNYDYQALPDMKRLARALTATGDTLSAEGLWKKIIQTETAVFGPEHPRVAQDFIGLAETEMAPKGKEKAKSDLQKSLAILGHCFQEDHPLVLQTQALLKELSKNHP